MSVESNLAKLESSELIRRASDPDPTYLFKHTLSQEMAYGSLLVKKRRQVHLQVAQTVEKLYADRLEEFAAILAQHYCEAGDDVKTVEYAVRAGDAAMRVYANTEAVAEYSLALDAAARSSPSSEALLRDIYLKRGRALELLSRFDDAARNYDQMKEAAATSGDRAFELAALISQATIRSIPGSARDAEQAQALAERALALARELGDRRAEAKILWTMLLIGIYGGGDPLKAKAHGEQSLAIAREVNLREQMAFTLNDLFVAYTYLGEIEKARAARQEAANLWRGLDNRPMLAESVSGLALLAFMQGNFDQALQLGQESFQISKAIGNLGGQGFSGYGLSLVYLERGEYDQALKFMAEGIPITEAGGLEGNGISPIAMLGYIHASLGDPTTARVFIHRTLDRASASLAIQRMWIYSLLTRVELMSGNLEAAESAFREGAIAPSMDTFVRMFPPGAPQLYLASCELALAQGKHDRALEIIRALLDHLRKITATVFNPEAKFLEGKVLLATGDLGEAVATWEAARAEAQAQTSRRTWWQILFALSEAQAASGNAEEAERLRAEACMIVEYIVAHTPSELRASYLNLPNVRSVMKQ